MTGDADRGARPVDDGDATGPAGSDSHIGRRPATRAGGIGDRSCGPLYGLYAAARDGDLEAARDRWPAIEPVVADLDAEAAARVDAALADRALDDAQEAIADVLFVGSASPDLDGPVATLVGTVLYGFGYLASSVLFFRARSREAVVDRLRWAYRRVGVDIRDVETADGTARTVFRCPYRNLGAARYGRRRVCHDVLDRVDDGYVTFLARHRDLEYDRPRACAGSECCYSEVSDRP